MEIKDILDDSYVFIGDKEIILKGWVKNFRYAKKGKLLFIELYDGSTISRLQCVYNSPTQEIKHQLSYMSSVKLKGKIVESPGRQQKYEFLIENIEIIGQCPTDEYPLPKTILSFEHLRQYPHLRMRTDTITAVMRIRHQLIMGIHNFFNNLGYLNIHTPLITSSDCEGAGEAFCVTNTYFEKQRLDIFNNESKFLNLNQDTGFFPSPSFLTVSGQLQAEAAALSLGKVYTFGPTFRAEKSQTNRHLSEFWMIEPEAAFLEFTGLIELAKDLLNYCIKYCVDKCQKELKILKTLEKLKNFGKFKVVDYSEAILDLQASNYNFETIPKWGIDLGSEHERYLAEELYKLPTIITNYPKHIKPFYMHHNSDDKTVAAMDVLLPGIGEVIGGSQREIRYDILKEEMGKHKLKYEWYLDLRKYGSVPHSGFGLGFDRLLRYITGIDNIRDVVPFPVAYGSLNV